MMLMRLQMEVSELEGRVKEAEAGRREAEEDEEKARRTVQRLQEEVGQEGGRGRVEGTAVLRAGWPSV